MHRALEITEIVQMICASVGPPGTSGTNPRQSSRTLAALARTCTVFHSHALDLLWRKTKDAKLILHCMPEDLWEKTPMTVNNWRHVRLEPTRPMLPSDWDRFGLYSTRIRVLASDSRFDFSEVFETIALCPPPRPMFPNLHTLYWTRFTNSASLYDFRAFLGPKIASCTLSGLTPGSRLSLLPHLLSCPTLRQLTISSPRLESSSPHTERTVRAISTLVRALFHMESLTLWSLDPEALEHIGRLRTLKRLTLEKLPPLDTTSIYDQPMFTSLESLNLALEDIRAATTFVSMWSMAPLDSLSVVFTGCPTAAEMEKYQTTLTAHCSLASLRSVTIGLHPSHVPAGAALHSLRTLTSFVNLKHVEITSPVGFDLDDSIVLGIARAWPQIVELLLLCLKSPSHPRVTLASLSAFAQYCPCLARLRIQFDATVLPSSDEMSARIDQKSLDYLRVANSPIDAPMPVAKFISGIFSNLAQIDTDEDYVYFDADDPEPEELARYRRWREVEELLPHLLEIREQERRWTEREYVS